MSRRFTSIKATSCFSHETQKMKQMVFNPVKICVSKTCTWFPPLSSRYISATYVMLLEVCWYSTAALKMWSGAQYCTAYLMEKGAEELLFRGHFYKLKRLALFFSVNLKA